MNKKIYRIELKRYMNNPVTGERYFYIEDSKYKCSGYGYIYLVGTNNELNKLLELLDDNVKSVEIYTPVYTIKDFKEDSCQKE